MATTYGDVAVSSKALLSLILDKLPDLTIDHVPVSIASMPLTAVSGTFWQSTQPVSLSSLPLPPGASTSALQAACSAYLASIDAKTPALVAGRQPIDGSGVVQPVSGTFWPATQAVSGTFWPATQPVSITSMPSTPVTGIFFQPTQPVSLAASPLPPGAATDANQVLNGSAAQASLTVTTTAFALRAGAANLAGRRSIIIQPNAAGYSYGFSAALQPFALTNGTSVQLNIGANITVWASKSSGTSTIAVVELA